MGRLAWGRCGRAVALAALLATVLETSSPPASASGRAATLLASEPGLTPTSITVANVSILSGPVPGLFEGAPYGAEAYAAYIDSRGGVNGRQLKVTSLDDGFSCSQNQSETQSGSTQDFAFVGSFSLFDNCGAKVLAANPDIPDVSVSLDPVAKALPNNYSPQPAPPGIGTGPFVWIKQQYPKAVKSVGSLVGNVASAVQNWVYQRAAMQSLGYHVSYYRAVSPLETDFTSDILRMRDAGVQLLYLTDVDAADVARVMNEAHQQGWHPQITVATTGYDGSFFGLTSPAAAGGLLMPLPNAMYLGQDSKTTPAVGTFLTWMHRTHPNFQPDIFSLYGWTSAQLFSQALAAAGPDPTRASVLSALRNIHSFNASGLLATANVGSKQPPTCWVMAKTSNGRFVRATPSRGFRCNPGGYYYYRQR
jgi:ABC-type branched-subunit amino acid transport system substrate-binding protein